ncbi:MAG: hypothetical protein Ct9H300mP11_05870 [Chloroflexota bacterium]|nr:MAG: hypothetical protein Ct9H300mP11_05870 [Chloroflexota bacterium]
MSFDVAPTARLIPISFVLSTTETNIIFITPIAPTKAICLRYFLEGLIMWS